MYVFSFKLIPFKDDKLFKFGEGMLHVITIHVVLLSKFVTNEDMRYSFSILMIGLFTILMVVSIMFIAFDAITGIINKIY